MAEAPAPPSPFVVRHRETLQARGRTGLCLDLACGRGRHARLLAEWGLRVVGLDRNRDSLDTLAGVPGIEVVAGDAEDARGLPFRPGSFALLVVTRFLDRSRCGAWAELLAPGGLLLYETFRDRQRELGSGPRNPAFLLGENELPTLFPDLIPLDHEEALRETPQREWVASLLARRPD